LDADDNVSNPSNYADQIKSKTNKAAHINLLLDYVVSQFEESKANIQPVSFRGRL
jgi:hypothetical protein